MEKYITKKRKLSNDDQSTVAIAKSESTSTGTFEKKKNCLYCHNYLNIGFTCWGDKAQPVSVYLICHAKLSNEAMLPSKLRRHFLKKHGHLFDKLASNFKRLLNEQKQPIQIFTKSLQVSTKCQQASYLVAEIIAKIQIKNSKP